MILIGAGYLGHALASYNGFEHRGFRIVGVFDNDEAKIGTTIGAATIQPIDAIPTTVERYRCQIAIIAVPATSAQQVAGISLSDRYHRCPRNLIAAGIKSILCYAPLTLTVPPHVRVEYIDPVIYFQHMTFYLSKGCIDE